MNDNVIRNKFAEPVDQESVAGDWAERGYSCRLFIDPPGQQWNDFVHGTNELVTVVEGRLAMIVEGVRVEMGPGDEVFIPRHATHSVHNIHSGTSRWLFGYD
jgi:mannose-6-phosphate isomerase-like protein (cupin superfamily)